MIRKVIEYPDPVLVNPAMPVMDFGPELEHLVQDMFETQKAENGIGLAANQIGVALRVLVVSGPEVGNVQLAMINPSVKEVSNLETGTEGCLSLPGLQVEVTRPTKLTAIYLTPDGVPKTIEAEGLLARAILHEIDHLNGRLIIDYLSGLKRRMAVDGWRKERKNHNRSIKRLHRAVYTGRRVALQVS
jgi:peptide deformylase